MAIKTQVNAILNKKMDRQDFIKHVAVGVVALTGAGTALRLLAPKSASTTKSVSSGYGNSSYGGPSNGNKLG
jgi:hypothetical protein